VILALPRFTNPHLMVTLLAIRVRADLGLLRTGYRVVLPVQLENSAIQGCALIARLEATRALVVSLIAMLVLLVTNNPRLDKVRAFFVTMVMATRQPVSRLVLSALRAPSRRMDNVKRVELAPTRRVKVIPLVMLVRQAVSNTNLVRRLVSHVPRVLVRQHRDRRPALHVLLVQALAAEPVSFVRLESTKIKLASRAAPHALLGTFQVVVLYLVHHAVQDMRLRVHSLLVTHVFLGSSRQPVPSAQIAPQGPKLDRKEPHNAQVVRLERIKEIRDDLLVNLVLLANISPEQVPQPARIALLARTLALPARHSVTHVQVLPTKVCPVRPSVFLVMLPVFLTAGNQRVSIALLVSFTVLRRVPVSFVRLVTTKRILDRQNVLRVHSEATQVQLARRLVLAARQECQLHQLGAHRAPTVEQESTV
jgi:hypothetical protein